MNVFLGRAKGFYRRQQSRVCARRPAPMHNDCPIVSFTFDDFPKSALTEGGGALLSHGVRGTYYVSLGLLGKLAPTGQICDRNEVERVLSDGHELGCHTFDHSHAGETLPFDFRRSISKNQEALRTITTSYTFSTISYPLASPSPANKRCAAQFYRGCRGGGQNFNRGTLDLNAMSAFFLEQSIDKPDVIYKTIDDTCRERGWLIFATHDVATNPTRWGCQPALFNETIEYALRAGARVLPVTEALKVVDGS